MPRNKCTWSCGAREVCSPAAVGLEAELRVAASVGRQSQNNRRKPIASRVDQNPELLIVRGSKLLRNLGELGWKWGTAPLNTPKRCRKCSPSRPVPQSPTYQGSAKLSLALWGFLFHLPLIFWLALQGSGCAEPQGWELQVPARFPYGIFGSRHRCEAVIFLSCFFSFFFLVESQTNSYPSIHPSLYLLFWS